MNQIATIKNNRGNITFQLSSKCTKKYYPELKGSKYIYLGLPDNDENQLQARIKLKELISDLESGIFNSGNEDKYKFKEKVEESIIYKSAPSLKDLIFLEWNTKLNKGIIHESTYKGRLSIYGSLLDKLPKDISDTKGLEEVIDDFYKTVHCKIRALKQIITTITWAIREEKISDYFENSLKKIKRLKDNYTLASKKCKANRKNKLGEIKSEFAYYSEEERDIIIQAFYEKKFKVNVAELVEFIFCTGVRTQEAFALTWGDIYYDKNGDVIISINKAYASRIHKIKTTKNGKKREFKVNSRIKELLKRLSLNSEKNKNDLIFETSSGKFNSLSLNQYWYGLYSTHNSKFYPRVVYSLYEEGKISKYLPPYQMRASFVTHQLLKGKSPLIISKWTGHDAQTLLKHYEKLSGMEDSPAD